MEEQKDSVIPEEVVQSIVKKKDRRAITSPKNNPHADLLRGTGDNAKYLSFVLGKNDWPRIDTGDPVQVKDRIEQYFLYCAEHDMRPTVSGLASSLGISRMALWKWKQGIDRPQNFALIGEAYDRLEELWELYMMEGKIVPPNGIFLGKNLFGYKDVQDVVVTPNDPLKNVRSADEIAEQYKYLPEE